MMKLKYALVLAALAALLATDKAASSQDLPRHASTEDLLRLETEVQHGPVPARAKAALAKALLADRVPNSHSFSKALVLLHQASEAGAWDASFMLSVLYRNGVRVDKNDGLARQFVSRALDQISQKHGTEYLAVELALMDCQQITRPTAWSGYTQNIDRLPGYAIARLVSCRRRTGWSASGVDETGEMLAQAARKGADTAQFALGIAYENGQGYPQDYIEARRWYEEAVEQGLEDAAFNLANLLASGNLGEPDYEGTFSIYRQLAESGNIEAQYLAVEMVVRQATEQMAFEDVLPWLNNLSKHGYGISYFYLAVAYEHGFGADRDIKRALEYYERAANSNLSFAQEYLGNLYALGKYVPRDQEKALSYYEQAAKHGSDSAKHNIEVLTR